ncbi:MAG: hypothetical protein K2P88_04200 [Chitinophagaceae bacterium]|uniref:sensor histidine kinase n=1 Tax=unclassified Paraflavitalea TaxID=2798305 RepID=UPI003D3573A6|nr:hypothetical protein [Chitinophagaceae bacterium]
MQDSVQYIYTAIIASTFAFLILFIFFLSAFNKSRKQRITQIEKDKLISAVYEYKLSESEVHAQESTLNYVGKELHDRVGLTLTLAKLTLNSTVSKLPPNVMNDFANIEQTITDAIKELKEISMGINSDLISEFGLHHSVENEVSRINRLTSKRVEYDVIGTPFQISNDFSIAIIRVIQELLNNLIKYSQTKKIIILLEYSAECMQVSIVDNGDPIKHSTPKINTSGLINIRHRLKLLDSQLESLVTENENITFFKIKKP